MLSTSGHHRAFPAPKGAICTRREFDLLPTYPEIDIRPAAVAELPAMVDLARTAVPGVRIELAAVERIFRHQAESIYPYRSAGRIVGGIAFLHLTDAGLDQVLLGEFDFARPDLALLTPAGEVPAALYIWAVAARGRAAGGMGNTANRMHRSPFAQADFYAQPSTADGERILERCGFEPISSFQPNLWTYQRLCNRRPIKADHTLHRVA